MDIMTLTRKDILNIPYPEKVSDIGVFDSLIIVPTRKKHDSGYMCMDFITVKGHETQYRLSGWSDVLHLDGIGGYGSFYFTDIVGTFSDRSRLHCCEVKGWTIDCIPCGLIRLFANKKLYIENSPLSDMDIYASSRKGE